MIVLSSGLMCDEISGWNSKFEIILVDFTFKICRESSRFELCFCLNCAVVALNLQEHGYDNLKNVLSLDV